MSAASVSQSLYNRRRVVNAIALLLSCVTALFGLFFLAWILWTLVSAACRASTSTCLPR